MSTNSIVLTDLDRNHLAELIEMTRERCDPDSTARLAELEQELDRARIVSAAEVPAHIVRMGSRVQFHDVDTGEALVYTLVWPHLADPADRKVSVLAPIGMALLGAAVGQTVDWQVPAGRRRLFIDAADTPDATPADGVRHSIDHL